MKKQIEIKATVSIFAASLLCVISFVKMVKRAYSEIEMNKIEKITIHGPNNTFKRSLLKGLSKVFVWFFTFSEIGIKTKNIKTQKMIPSMLKPPKINGSTIQPQVVKIRLKATNVFVKVLRMPDKDTLYGQYIAFSKVYDVQRKIYKNKIECIRNTLDICIKEGYLRDFLEQHRQEVVTMLSSLFDEQAQREQYDIAVKAESKAEGEELGRLKTLAGLVKDGLLSLAEAAKRAGMTPTDFEIKTVGLA